MDKAHSNGGVAPARRGGMDNVVPPTPHWFIFLRYGQLALNVIVLICAAVALGSFGKLVGDGYYLGFGPGFAIFSSVYILIFLVAVILIPIYVPNFYFKWLILGAECFAILWSLITFSGLAVWSTAFTLLDGTTSYYESQVNTIHGATAAGAAFGAFLWVSLIVSLVFYAIACHKARVAKKSWNTPSNMEASMGPIGTQQHAPAYDTASQPVGYGYESR